MRLARRCACFIAVAATTLALQPVEASAAEGIPPTGSVVSADYPMNEGSGATVMQDGSGNGLDGTIDPTGVQTGTEYGGATGYLWAWRNPTAPPASPERVIQVPDDSNLEPGDQAFTIEIRYRTHANFGNIAQKGQSHTAGGQWKIQNPQGRPSCLFKGSSGRVSTRAPSALSDDQWHTLTCVLDSSGVTLYVDGVERNHKTGNPGTIDNAQPMTVGGKIECDQVTVTCDYFTGQIDYLTIWKSPRGTPPPSSGEVSLVGATAKQSKAKNVWIRLPATAAGQQLVMVLSRNRETSATPPSGWTRLTGGAARSLFTDAWTKTATTSDVGANIKVVQSRHAKSTLTVAAYAGADPLTTFALGTDPVAHSARITPTVTATDGSWLVSYWADKSAHTTAWSVSGATVRADACNTGGGHVCSALADSAAPLAGGAAGGLTATTDATSSAAVMWSIVVAPAG